MTNAAKKQTEEQSFDELLHEGVDLYRELAEKKDRLSEIKEMVREHAEAVRKGETTVELKTEDGEQTVSVTFPADSLKVKKKADMDGLREKLGDLIFDMFFKTKVKYSASSDFEENVEKVDDPLQKQAISGVVEKKSSTPRVSFPK
jgi:NTP pyrophosphatase (non-canonical NTP hydrolase)